MADERLLLTRVTFFPALVFVGCSAQGDDGTSWSTPKIAFAFAARIISPVQCFREHLKGQGKASRVEIPCSCIICHEDTFS
jgi:hypothetical protein